MKVTLARLEPCEYVLDLGSNDGFWSVFVRARKPATGTGDR